MELTNQATIETIDQIIDAKQCEIAEQKNIEYQLDWDSADISDVRMKRYTLEQEVQALVRVKNAFISAVSKPQPPLRKEQPSVESMLQELKKSDNYLMSNPFKDDYESAFDR